MSRSSKVWLVADAAVGVGVGVGNILCLLKRNTGAGQSLLALAAWTRLPAQPTGIARPAM